jgi:glycosyltransferase involved in cell wall biosynthesis
MSMGQVVFSVVVPVYNSRKTLPELCARIEQSMQALQEPWQIVLVNDCSADDSWQVIKELKAQFGDKLIAVNLGKNSGQHKALLCGFQFAEGKYVITIDDDLQFYPEDIPLLIGRAQETRADLVYGYYKNGRKHSTLRRKGSSFVAFIFEKFGNTKGQGSSFKLINKSVTDKVKDYHHSFTFLDEILSWHTSSVAYAEVRHAPRREGRSGYSLFKLVFITLNLIFGYTTIPLRIMTWFGFISFWVCLMFICYFLYLKYTQSVQLGFTAFMVSIFMSTGLILFSLGIIGEYLNRLIALQHKKPAYLVKEVLL